MFKDQLSRIYSMEEWPAYTELIPMLTRYATATENMNDLKKEIGTPLTAMKATSSGNERKNDSDEQGGRRTVKNKVNKRYVCPCCGKKGHHDIEGCKFKDKTCNICKKKGHLARMCPSAEDEEDDHDDKRVEAQVARFMAYVNSESEDDS
jgi:hypothetical protein